MSEEYEGRERTEPLTAFERPRKGLDRTFPSALRPTGPTERRAVPRFTALDPRGWIGWWAEGDFHEAEARLLDVGEFGAAVEVDRLPPRDCPLFFSLGGPTTIESVEAEIVAVQPGRQKKSLVRLSFSTRCPVRLFTAIIDGPATLPPSPRDPGPKTPSTR